MYVINMVEVDNLNGMIINFHMRHFSLDRVGSSCMPYMKPATWLTESALAYRRVLTLLEMALGLGVGFL